MRNKIILIGLIAVVTIPILYLNQTKRDLPSSETPENIAQNEQIETDADAPTVEANQPLYQNLPNFNNKDFAWDLFQRYLAFNKDQNLDGVKSSVYKISDICNTEKPTKECGDRMTSAYNYGSALKKEEFMSFWQDEKQMILATDFWTEESGDLGQYGRFRAIIFFVKDQNQSWKLLSFSPFKGPILNTRETSREEVLANSIKYTEDKDTDGKSDYEEECLHKPEDSSCIKTDPTKRDSDGDGFWDGTEALF